MNQYNLFDIVFLGFAGLSVLTACWRGLGKETLHTLLFFATMTGAYFFFQTQDVSTKESAVRTLLNFGYFSISSYFITWVVMKFLGPVFLDDSDVGMRGRFWAGLLALTKIVGVALALNLWFAVHSTDAHPLRLNGLPPILQESTLVRLSDSTTEEIYQWLASKGWLSYEKFTHRPKTDEEMQQEKIDQAIGLKASPTTTP